MYPLPHTGRSSTTMTCKTGTGWSWLSSWSTSLPKRSQAGSTGATSLTPSSSVISPKKTSHPRWSQSERTPPPPPPHPPIRPTTRWSSTWGRFSTCSWGSTSHLRRLTTPMRSGRWDWSAISWPKSKESIWMTSMWSSTCLKIASWRWSRAGSEFDGFSSIHSTYHMTNT